MILLAIAIIIIAVILFIIAMLYFSSIKRASLPPKSFPQEQESFTDQSFRPKIYAYDLYTPNVISQSIGFSTGGAKDTNNFRENIKYGYFPISTDITYNGLFYDYYFETGKKTQYHIRMNTI